MEDLIKRSDAIRAVEECLKLLARPRYTVKTAIEAIPSVDIPHSDDWEKYSDKLWKNAYERGKADRPQEWIPCSERLPSEQGQYLVTFPLCNGEPWVYILSFNKGKFYETDDEWGDVEYDDVTAWMPLPEPWKGADDGVDDV